MKLRLNLLVFVIAAFIGTSYAFDIQKTDFTTIIASRFSKQWYQMPQEKVYLHTDKPYYSAGETIWFKAYLVNAATHYQNTKSRYIYTELLDLSDSVIFRVKIRKDSTGFAGHIKLPAELVSGKYSIRAYTYWMQNAPEEFFFRKQILIGNGIDDRIKCDIKYGSLADGKLPVNLTFTNTFDKPLEGKVAVINQTWQNSKNKFAQTTDNNGKIRIYIPYNLTDTLKRILDISITEPGVKFNNKFVIPELNNDFDLQFLPESGTFLNNQMQTLAFKAVGRNGLGIDVNGTIYNNNNEVIAEFKSINKGMGRVSIKTNPGESYYAIVQSSGGVEKKYNLPSTQEKGINLSLTYNRGKINYQIYNQTDKENGYSLLIHSRGVVYVVLPIVNSMGQITESLLPSGIVSFSVIDSIGNVYCERLAFVKNLQLPDIKMNQDKLFYGKRMPVHLDFTVHDKNGNPIKGNFSVSVTDSKLVEKDTVNDNILSYLLLSSDIKGYIEEPARYFADNLPATREKLDILMCTQGWRRFSTERLAKGEIKIPDYYLEAGQTVSGRVLNLFNKPVSGSEIIMFSKYKNSIALGKTDSVGKFIIDGIEYPDSTGIILKAKSKTKLVDVELIPDKDLFPKASIYFPVGTNYNPQPSSDYLIVSKEKYYTDGGMLTVNLQDFTVTGDANKKNGAETRYYTGMASYEMNQERLEEYPGFSVMDLLVMVPGVQVDGNSVSIRGGGSPLFMVDGIETENLDDITYLNSSDIEKIEVFKGADAAIFGSKGGNGVIAIELKKGVVHQAVTPPSLVHFMPLGFQKPEEFYVPKYNVDSIRNIPRSDLRTTVYWKPLIVSDANGNFSLDFYTADRANNYNIALEGI